MGQFNKICVMGLGYIGLPTSAMFASRGIEVIGVDKNPHVLETVAQGRIHIVEPDLEGLVFKVVRDGKLKPSAKPEEADAFLITVPTPLGDNKKPGMDYVEAATRDIAPYLKKGCLVVLESTSPVGSTEKMAATLAELRPDLSFPQQNGDESDVHVVHCPERVLPGKILSELVHNDRIIGGMSRRSTEAGIALYRNFVRGDCKPSSAPVAELVKLTENAFRDVNIAFANELSMVCGRLGLNVWDVIALANCHPRVNILQPGPGVGGHCIAVDPWFIVDSAPNEARLIRTAREINDAKTEYVIEKIKEAAGRLSVGKKPVIACLGLAFKPNVDDLRESPALHITEALAACGDYEVLAVEPNIERLPDNLHGVKMSDALSAIGRADIVVALVAHQQFGFIDPAKLSSKIVIDSCGLFRKE